MKIKFWVVQAFICSIISANAYAANCNNFPVVCNDVEYNACFKDIMDQVCKGNEKFCNSRTVNDGAQKVCACANIDRAQEKTGICNNVISPADFKAGWGRPLKKIGDDSAVYCDGYAKTPCDEEKFKACVHDFETTFCKNTDCVIAPAFGASCACDNLLNKNDKALNTMCQKSLPPAQLKIELQKLHDEVKTSTEKAAATNGSAAPMLPRTSIPISISPEQEKKYQPICIENLKNSGANPEQFMAKDQNYMEECMAYYAVSDTTLAPEQDKKYRPMCLENLRQMALTFGKDPQQYATENQLYLRHCMADLAIDDAIRAGSTTEPKYQPPCLRAIAKQARASGGDPNQYYDSYMKQNFRLLQQCMAYYKINDTGK